MIKTNMTMEFEKILQGTDWCINPIFVNEAEKKGYDIEVRLVEKEEEKAPVGIDEKKGNPRYDKQYLYKMTFPNGMVYIGIAYDIRSRWANNGAGYRGQKIWEPISHFGWDNIKREVLMYIPIEKNGTHKLREMERELIHQYDEKCYNVMSTKEHGKRISKIGYDRGYYKPKVYLTVDGIRKPAKDWCAEYGVPRGRLMRRMNLWGLTAKQALTFPPVPNGYNKKPMEYWRECGCFDEDNSNRA